jgi:hypothetical protein
MGSIDPNPSDKLRSKVEQNYWLFMANIIMSFETFEIKEWLLKNNKYIGN